MAKPRRQAIVMTRFKMNYKGIAAVALSPKVSDVVTDVARTRALPFAKSIAPRSRKMHRHYADAFKVEKVLVTDIGGPPRGPMPRHGARLVNTAPHALVVEVGASEHEAGGQTVSSPAHRVLRNTLIFLAATKDQQ